MKRLVITVLLMLICLPGLTYADFETPRHKWAISYEDGVTLRRFLGDNWEVYLGGGPNDDKWDKNKISYRSRGNSPLVLDDTTDEFYKNESGFVKIGIGHKVLREDRFWLTATMAIKYRWSNFQRGYHNTEFDSDDFSHRNEVGHTMTTKFSVGIRPAYDLTPRITLMLHFGFYYQNSTSTKDLERYSQYNGTSLYKERIYNNTDRTGTFGYADIYSIKLMFRF